MLHHVLPFDVVALPFCSSFVKLTTDDVGLKLRSLLFHKPYEKYIQSPVDVRGFDEIAANVLMWYLPIMIHTANRIHVMTSNIVIK